MEVQEVRTIDQAESIASEWEELWQRSVDPTPFQSPRWLIPWWQHIGEGQLLILAIRSGTALAGILPMFIHREPHSTMRKLMLLGAGSSDYLDGVFAPEGAHAAISPAFNHLRTEDRDWDVCELHQLCPESPLMNYGLPDGWCDELRPAERCPVLALPNDPDHLNRVIPTHQWDKLQYYRRRAARAVTLDFALTTEENFDDFFDAFLRLHRMRFDAQRHRTSLRHGNVEAFHRQAARALLSAGTLRLILMKVDGRAAAAFYGFKVGRRSFFYLGGFDPAMSRLSPGMLVIGFAIEQAVREGCRTFDFLRGQECYKYHWGALDSVTYCRSIRPEPVESAFETNSKRGNLVPGV